MKALYGIILVEPLTEGILHRIPAVEKAEIRQMINGPDAFTADGRAILGEAPGVRRLNHHKEISLRYCGVLQIRNYFVVAGMNGFGIASAGGFGRALAEWIANGKISLPLSLSFKSILLTCTLR